MGAYSLDGKINPKNEINCYRVDEQKHIYVLL